MAQRTTFLYGRMIINEGSLLFSMAVIAEIINHTGL
jgi:hypothetical protein